MFGLVQEVFGRIVDTIKLKAVDDLDQEADRCRQRRDFARGAEVLRQAIVKLNSLELKKLDKNAIRGHFLDRLATFLREQGHSREATQASRDAIAAMRVSAKEDAETHRPDLSRLLYNFGNSLTDLEEWPDAFVAYRESIEHRRRLAEQYAEAFRPKLTRTIGRYGRALLLSGRPEDAIKQFKAAIREATDRANAR